MPPYTLNKSRSQQRKMFALANRGELSMADARGKARASKGLHLPERLKKRSGTRAKARGRSRR